MTKAVHTSLLYEKALSNAAVGSILYWMGELLRVDITEDGRRIAYPLVKTQEDQAA